MVNNIQKGHTQHDLDRELHVAESRILRKKKTKTHIVHYDTVFVMALELMLSMIFLGCIGKMADSVWNIRPVGMVIGIVLGFIAGIRLVCWNLAAMKHRLC